MSYTPQGTRVPFFTGRDGKVFTTTVARELAQRLAAACGMEPELFGGKSWRIGGATDGAVAGGERWKALVQKRGRWDSDIHDIYSRPMLESALELSARMGDVVGDTLEEALVGVQWTGDTGVELGQVRYWAQPAWVGGC